LAHEGGHIGYGVRPSERGKGYGTEVCRRTLEAARGLGLARVLITCDTDNPASARIIEKNGGVLENEVRSRETGKMKRRYWVTL
jgi:predicted acetyltransferase